jgi:hypothetical protein
MPVGQDLTEKWQLFRATDNSECIEKSSPKDNQNTHEGVPNPNTPHETFLASCLSIGFHEYIQP